MHQWRTASSSVRLEKCRILAFLHLRGQVDSIGIKPRNSIPFIPTCAAILLAFSNLGLTRNSDAAVNADIIIDGEVMGQGAPCVQFRLDNGETVSLEGASPQLFKTGMKFKLSGNWMRISTCMQGRAFKVSHSEEVK
jgi:hypothetical protein